MDLDVFWRLDRNGRVKSRVCSTAHGLFLLFYLWVYPRSSTVR